MAANPVGEGETGALRLQFDRSVRLAFQGSSISSDGGLLLHRELDDALGLTDFTAAGVIGDPRTGRNGRHRLAGLLRQSIFSRLAGYEDVNDADRLRRDPVMRQLVGGRAVKRGAASASAMGRFETAMLTRPENLAALDRSPRPLDRRHSRSPPAEGRHARHGQFREPCPRRSGGGHVERPLPLEVPAPAVRVQPVRRPGEMRSAARQRPQRRRLGGRPAPGAGAVFQDGTPLDHAPALPRRCRIRHPGAVRSAGGRGLGLRRSASRATPSCTSGSPG